MKAIETLCRGYRFRSRLEARWSVIFDALGLRWDYEPEGFTTAAGRYLPDFYVHDWGQWVEIKGQQPDRHELDRFFAFAQEHPIAMFRGLPGDSSEDSNGGSAWAADGAVVISPGAGCLWIDEEGALAWAPSQPSQQANLFVSGPRARAALAAAKGARFEFGEAP